MSNKLKILWCGEASFLKTGYGKYSNAILNRLFKDTKYEIAEFATYAHYTDKVKYNIPWKFYGNAPSKNSHEEQVYYSSRLNEWGAWRFNEVILDFKPDYVLAIRDPWMDEHQTRSYFRDKYRLIWMPTLDSFPQREEYINMYLNVDGLLTYTEYGRDNLLSQTNNAVNIYGTAPYGMDFELYQPRDKSEIRSKFGMLSDLFIVGSVMRNQKRKLFPDLILAFKRYLEKALEVSQELYNKSFLYLHTSYPDIGWDIPLLVKESGIGHKILFTYLCNSCGSCFPAFFSEAKTSCINCGSPSARLPTHKEAVSEKQLSYIYNTFDLYVQYSICLPENEQVYVNSQWMNIQDVKSGDIAFTHNSKFQKITKTFKHHINEDIINLSVYGDFESLRLTREHPVLTLSLDTNRLSVREKLGNNLRLNKNIPSPKFVEAQDINHGDMVGFIIDDSITKKETLDLCDFITDKNNNIYILCDDDIIKYKYTKNKSRYRYIDIDKNFCKFVGLFVADGSVNKAGTIKVTSNMLEKHTNIAFCKEYFKKLNNKYSIRKYKNRKAIDIMINDKLLSLFFMSLGKLENKCLPDWCLYLPTEMQKEILQGLFMGDGCFVKEHNITKNFTISKKLAEQIKFILRRCRINFNVHKKCRQNRKDGYVFEIYGNAKNGEFEINNRKNTRNLYINNIHYMQIKNVISESYNGYVYNFEVENDNSYLSKLCCVHNCEGLGIPMLEAAACGVPIMAMNYSAMDSVTSNLDGYKVDIKYLFREPESLAYRAYPDNEDCANKILSFAQLSDTEKATKQFNTRLNCKKFYNWDSICNQWVGVINSIKPYDRNKWNLPPVITIPNLNIPNNLNNDDFIRWIILNIWRRPDKLNSYIHIRMLRDLSYGAYAESGFDTLAYQNDLSSINEDKRFTKCTRESLIKTMLAFHADDIYWEQRRTNLIIEPRQEFIIHA